jgi:seryl-tRNA synthetase
MSISPISSASSYQASQVSWQNNLAQRRQDFKDLASALQLGDLAGAQKAFAAMQQSQPNFSATTQTQNAQQASVQDPLADDFSALDKALNSTNPNLKAAQDAFAKLLQDMQSVKGHHRHHHKASASTQSTASTTSSPSVGSTTGSGQNGSASGSIDISV